MATTTLDSNWTPVRCQGCGGILWYSCIWYGSSTDELMPRYYKDNPPPAAEGHRDYCPAQRYS